MPVKDLKEALLPETTKEIDLAVYEQMRDYAVAFQAGGGPETVDVMNEQRDILTRLAMLQAAGSADGPTDIVTGLYGQMFPEIVISSGNVNVIVPADVDVDNFQSVIETKMTDKALKLATFPDIPNLPTEGDQELFIRHIQDFGQWVTNSEGTGAVLMGLGYKVLDESGNPYQVLFGDVIDVEPEGRGDERVQQIMRGLR